LLPPVGGGGVLGGRDWLTSDLRATAVDAFGGTRGLNGRGGCGGWEVGIGPGEGVGAEASKRVATAIGAEPGDVEATVVGFDAVGGRTLADAVGTDREAGENVAVLIENRLEVALALTDASDRRLLHGWTENSWDEVLGKLQMCRSLQRYEAGTTRSETRRTGANGATWGSVSRSSRSSPTRS
jgi:hypothetical protein